MIRLRNGKIWKVGVASVDFRAPAPASVQVVKGAKVLFRVTDHEILFPGDERVHVVRDTHALLTNLVKPAWPWGAPDAPEPLHGEAGKPKGLNPGWQAAQGQGVWRDSAWAKFALQATEEPEGIEKFFGKEPGWVQRVLDEDPEVMSEDPLLEFEFSKETGT